MSPQSPAEDLVVFLDSVMVAKLLLASLAGGLVGFERERHGRPAGLRTHLLVALAACLMMIVSEAFFLKYEVLSADSVVRLDPARIAAQIVTGIGFLGAGVILKEGVNVRGLTTAASLWVVAGLGMAFGAGLFAVGALATVLALISLVWLKRLDPMLKKDRYTNFKVTGRYREQLVDEVEKMIVDRGLRIVDARMTINRMGGEIVLEYVITNHRRRIGRELTASILQLEGVERISYR
ncbi:putative Mg2+ transporter-C (MgtC) family protein [Geothermobacter ehrlichii]|uniref:Putative Mg2+ transporter-C (MgtC) family protein n=1 Tax=Geothermobacter ehrlichii TaxID=213224 RepID=A0A5D3WLV6_9BACT|nr:MgtC/SapB family protein [Geothermobacter ehrlichii]TYO98997.1 putative Mg2+ transporter-C (MgtC) family protein [Geothermobacter ehrlichii]